MEEPVCKSHTKRNIYGVCPILATFFLLKRLPAPVRWEDLIDLFGKWPSQMSEIFWDSIEHLLQARQYLITDPMDKTFIRERAESCAKKIYDKSNGLNKVVGFIDGNVLGIEIPKGNVQQRVVYNGRNGKHALKHQAVSSPGGLMFHVLRPIECRRHDRALYIRKDLEQTLPEVLHVNGRSFCIFEDSG